MLAFQATARLPETGVVDRPTWTALLGADAAAQLYDKAAQAAIGTVEVAEVTAVAAAASGGSAVVAAAAASIRVSTSVGAADAKATLTKWPVLMEGDGGREVHALQVRHGVIWYDRRDAGLRNTQGSGLTSG